MTSPFPLVELGRVLKQRAPDVPVVGAEMYSFAGVKSFGGGVFRSVTKCGTEFSYRTLTRLKAADFVYPKLMAWEGALGVVPPGCEGLVVSPEFCVFDIDRQQVEPRWLDLYFMQPRVWPTLAGGSAGTNVRRRRIYPDDFLRLKVPLPLITEQRRLLANVEEFIQDRRRWEKATAASVDAMKAAVFAEYHRLAVAAPIGALEDVAPLVRREVTVDPTLSYDELGIRSFGRGTFHKPPLRGVEVGTKRLFRIMPGDLLFNIVFAWEGAVAVARPEDTGRVGSHRFLTCVAHPGTAVAEFLCFHFLTEEGLLALSEASPGGAGRNRTLGLTAAARLPVPIPDYEEQRRFRDLLRWRDDVVARHHAAAERFDLLFPEVLCELFGGVSAPRSKTTTTATTSHAASPSGRGHEVSAAQRR